jgi:hypothetical protein
MVDGLCDVQSLKACVIYEGLFDGRRPGQRLKAYAVAEDLCAMAEDLCAMAEGLWDGITHLDVLEQLTTAWSFLMEPSRQLYYDE